jgi:hypothetical protein
VDAARRGADELGRGAGAVARRDDDLRHAEHAALAVAHPQRDDRGGVPLPAEVDAGEDLGPGGDLRLAQAGPLAGGDRGGVAAGRDAGHEAGPVRLEHRRAVVLALEPGEGDAAERVGLLDPLEVVDVVAVGERVLVEHELLGARDGVRAAAAQAAALEHAGLDVLVLAARLAGRADGDDLAAALLDLAVPRAVQPQVGVAVQLLEQREGEDDAVAGAVVGGEDLDRAVGAQALDPPVALVDAEAPLEAGGAAHEPGRLVEQDAGLVARRGGHRDHRVRGGVAVVQRDAAHQRRLAVALGDVEPDLRCAPQDLVDDVELEGSGFHVAPVSRTSSPPTRGSGRSYLRAAGPRRLPATGRSLGAALGDLVELLEVAAGVGLVLVAAAAGVSGRRLEQHPQLVHRGDVPAARRRGQQLVDLALVGGRRLVLVAAVVAVGRVVDERPDELGSVRRGR